MRRLLLFPIFLLALCCMQTVHAQVSSYTFTPVAGTYTPITGGTSPTFTGDGTNPIPDEGITNAVPIGFSFTFSGAPYTAVGISTNGFISFGAALTTWGFTNNLSTGPAGSTTARPLAAPLWDDMDVQATTNIQYLTVGSSPNKVFIVQWSNVKWNFGATAGTMDFQVRLYETTNVVEFVYNQLGGALNAATASIGLAAGATGSGNFLSLNNATAAPTTSSTVSTNTISAKPATGQIYRFTPPSCSAPSVTASAVSHNSATFNWPAASGATSYEYFVSTSATPPASGTNTTLLTYTASGLSPVTQYYFHIRSSCGAAFSSWATTPFKTSFDCSTAESISACLVSKTVSLSGAGQYNVTACGFNTPGNEKLYTFTAPTTGIYTLNITAANGNYIDYFIKAASGGCGESGWTCIDDNNAIGTDPMGTLTGGVTYFLLLDAEDNTVTATHTFEITCPAATPPSCTTLTSPANGATNVPMPPVLTWDAAPGATTYNVYFGTTNPPTTLLGSTTGTTATINGTVGGTTYYWYIAPANTAGEATGCASGTFSFTTPAPPVNDTICGAIALTLGGPQDCKNTVNASAAGDPVPSCSAANNTVWYTYTPATTGTVVVRTEIPGASTAPLDGWLVFYTATGSCPTLALTQLGDCTEFGITAGAVDSITSPVLTAGVTYYIMIDGFSGSAGDFCISLLAPPPPPPCVTNIAPANGATGVTSVSAGIALSWNAAAGATSYDVYFGTTPTPPLIGNTPSTTVNITGTSYNTTYYWYIAPRNVGGAATGCISNLTSFTTENPTNCIPSYTTGCSANDTLGYFSLKGASGTVIYNNRSPRCFASPNSYNDYTGTFPAVTLVRNESFSGFMQAGDPNDWVTMWIDGNDNGYFEDNERVMNNLSVGTTRKLYGLYIPSTTQLGMHRLRVRLIYSSTKPAAATHPCNPYQYGTTEDYMVNITNVGGGRSVSVGSPGNCIDIGATTIDALSNNNGSLPVFFLDSANNYVCAVYPNGNNFNQVLPSVYVHNGPVRQDVSGRYYLDRNISIAVDSQATAPYNLRYFFLNSELNALIAQPGSGVTSMLDLNMTKTTGNDCVTQYVQQSPTLVVPTGFGSLGGDRFLDFTGLTSFSRFFLHGGAAVLLPVTLTELRGEVTGNSNTLYWATAQEQNNRKFVIERSADGVNFTAIGEEASKALNGTSSTPLSYTFVDASPLNGKAYYRLRLIDRNDRQTLSQIVTLLRGKGKFEIVDVRPNPTTGTLYFNLVGSSTGATVVVRSMNGTQVLRKQFTQPSNFSIDMSGLAGGLYILEATDRNGEKAVFKISKQ